MSVRSGTGKMCASVSTLLSTVLLSLVLCVGAQPSHAPTDTPTDAPSDTPTNVPTDTPTDVPTHPPTDTPTNIPTDMPTDAPTDTPTNIPTDAPSDVPTDAPSDTPSDSPTDVPSDVPSDSPSSAPTSSPTASPSEAPTVDATIAALTVQEVSIDKDRNGFCRAMASYDCDAAVAAFATFFGALLLFACFACYRRSQREGDPSVKAPSANRRYYEDVGPSATVHNPHYYPGSANASPGQGQHFYPVADPPRHEAPQAPPDGARNDRRSSSFIGLQSRQVKGGAQRNSVMSMIGTSPSGQRRLDQPASGIDYESTQYGQKLLLTLTENTFRELALTFEAMRGSKVILSGFNADVAAETGFNLRWGMSLESIDNSPPGRLNGRQVVTAIEYRLNTRGMVTVEMNSYFPVVVAVLPIVTTEDVVEQHMRTTQSVADLLTPRGIRFASVCVDTVYARAFDEDGHAQQFKAGDTIAVFNGYDYCGNHRELMAAAKKNQLGDFFKMDAQRKNVHEVHLSRGPTGFGVTFETVVSDLTGTAHASDPVVISSVEVASDAASRQVRPGWQVVTINGTPAFRSNFQLLSRSLGTTMVLSLRPFSVRDRPLVDASSDVQHVAPTGTTAPLQQIAPVYEVRKDMHGNVRQPLGAKLLDVVNNIMSNSSRPTHPSPHAGVVPELMHAEHSAEEEAILAADAEATDAKSPAELSSSRGNDPGAHVPTPTTHLALTESQEVVSPPADVPANEGVASTVERKASDTVYGFGNDEDDEAQDNEDNLGFGSEVAVKVARKASDSSVGRVLPKADYYDDNEDEDLAAREQRASEKARQMAMASVDPVLVKKSEAEIASRDTRETVQVPQRNMKVDRRYATEAERIQAEASVEETNKRMEDIQFDFTFG